MKLKLHRQPDKWPDSPFHRQLRASGVAPGFRPYVVVTEKGGRDAEALRGEHQYLADHLVDDVTAEHTVSVALFNVQAVESGHVAECSLGGNAWFTRLRSDGVTFGFATADKPPGGRVSLRTYRAAVQAWAAFLRETACLERVVEIPD
jgi:hypothetical protein